MPQFSKTCFDQIYRACRRHGLGVSLFDGLTRLCSDDLDVFRSVVDIVLNTLHECFGRRVVCANLGGVALDGCFGLERFGSLGCDWSLSAGMIWIGDSQIAAGKH